MQPQSGQNARVISFTLSAVAVELRLALGDPETSGENPPSRRVGAAVLALTVAAVTEGSVKPGSPADS
jgi:hypothetical protein